MNKKIALIPGDGIWPEVVSAAVQVLWQVSIQIQEGTAVTESYFVGEKCYEDEADDFLDDDIFYGDNDQDDGDPEYTYETTLNI